MIILSIKHIDDASFVSELSGKTVLVDFWAEWCGPCRMLAPILEEVAEDLEGVAEVAKVNVDDSRALAEKYGIMSIPTLILFKDGQEAGRLIGLRSKDDIVNFVKSK